MKSSHHQLRRTKKLFKGDIASEPLPQVLRQNIAFEPLLPMFRRNTASEQLILMCSDGI